jgi:hypothetical protein
MHTLLTWLGTKDLDNMLNDTNAAISLSKIGMTLMLMRLDLMDI